MCKNRYEVGLDIMNKVVGELGSHTRESLKEIAPGVLKKKL